MLGLERWFGGPRRETSSAEARRLEALKTKYRTVLLLLDAEGVRLHNLHTVEGRLYVKGYAASGELCERIRAEILRLDPEGQELALDLVPCPPSRS